MTPLASYPGSPGHGAYTSNRTFWWPFGLLSGTGQQRKPEWEQLRAWQRGVYGKPDIFRNERT